MKIWKIKCAQYICDSLYFSAIEEEHQKNHSLYLQYLLALETNDTIVLKKTYTQMKDTFHFPEEICNQLYENRTRWEW